MAWIELEGAVNVRDLGGLPAADGSETIPGRLVRSDNLQALSAADVAKLVSDIGVRTVVDLRSPAEVKSEGPAPLDRVPEVRRAHYPVLAEGLGTNTVDEVLLSGHEQDRSRYPDDPACGRYLGYLENSPGNVVAAIRGIARSEGAVVVHCAAGKDRTGVVVALALSAVGVTRAVVIADYAATSERLVPVFERLSDSPTYASGLAGRPMESHRARPETMAAFLQQVDARYGGVDRWLSANGLTDEDLALLRAKLTGRGDS
jgi:protein-tyrosine phosphatase